MAESSNPAPVPGQAPWERPRSLILTAVWFGLVTGGIEATLLWGAHALRRCVLDYFSPIVWTIPLSNALLLIIPGLVFAFFGRRGVTVRLRKIALFFFAALAATLTIFGVCFVLTVRLFPPAIILLAFGLAVQVMRFGAKRPEIFHQLFRRTTPVFIAVPLLIGVITQAGYRWEESRSLKSLPPAPAGAPNVLLVVLDTVRAKSLSLYGNANDTTPNLKRWARRGVVFDQAIAPSPYTLTSHASMFSGLYPHQMTADWMVPMESGFPTLAEVLHSHGYVTAGFVANTYYTGRQTGLNRGFGHYIAHRLTSLEILVTSTLCRVALKAPRQTARAWEINDLFLDWLGRSQQRPFFAFLNYSDCHVPYEPEPDFDSMSKEEKLQVLAMADDLMEPEADTDPEHLALGHKAYEACLQGIDRHIDELLGELEKRGDLRNTIVIIVGDHGEQFGEHNIIQHADSLYRPALHVPLLVLAPNSPVAGKRIPGMVTLRDMAATILDLLKLPAGRIPGDSFAAAIRNGPEAALPSGPKLAFVSQGIKYPSWHPNSAGDIGAVFLDGKYLIRHPNEERLYDFNHDPEERTNMVEAGSMRELVEKLRPLVPVKAVKR